MADISKISPDGGTTKYNIKDATARTEVSTINGKIPSGASSSNKMATASDVTGLQDNVIANTKLIKDTVGWSGKNRFPITLDALKTANWRGTWNNNVYTDTSGVTFTVETEGEYVTAIKANGTASSIVSCFYIKNANFDGKYIVNGCPSGGEWGDTQKYRVRIGKYDGTFLQTDLGSGVEVTFPSGGGAEIQLNTGIGYACNNLTFKIMARDVDILDDTYEPYFGSTAFPRSEQAVLGAGNLLKFDLAAIKALNMSGTWNDNVYTYRGVVWTVNLDGTVSANGTAEANNQSELIYNANAGLANGTYYVSGGIRTGLKTYFYDGTQWYDCIGVPLPFTLNNPTNQRVALVVAKGVTINNEIFKPMVSLSADTPYAPYAMTNRELTENKVDKLAKVLTSSDDLDNIVETGFYYATTAPTHSPIAAGYYALIVMARNSTDAKQMVFFGNKIYGRALGGNPAAWSSWYEFSGTSVS